MCRRSTPPACSSTSCASSSPGVDRRRRGETIGPAPIDPAARQFMVPTRGGVRLATDVYLPRGDGPFPAVLVRLPYYKDGRHCWMPFIAPHFTAHGYAFVPQDVRGTFRFEGEPLAFAGEVPDVHPDGRAHALLFGQVVHDPAAGAPAEVYLGHTGCRVEPGHHLRLHVATSDFPVFLPQPGTHENPWDATETRRNRQTLATGDATPSYVSLTVLPPGVAPA